MVDNYMIASSMDKKIVIYDLNQPTIQGQFAVVNQIVSFSTVFSMAYLKKERLLVVGYKDGTLSFYANVFKPSSCLNQETKQIIKAHPSEIDNITLIYQNIIATSSQKEIKLWDVLTMKQLKVFQHDFEGSDKISTMKYNTSMDMLIIGDYKGNISTIASPVEGGPAQTSFRFKLPAYITSCFMFRNIICHVTGKHDVHMQEIPTENQMGGAYQYYNLGEKLKQQKLVEKLRDFTEIVTDGKRIFIRTFCGKIIQLDL